MGKLKGRAPEAAKPSKPKILLFGKPGVGKTWAAIDFPNVFYVDTEGGADLSHYTAKLSKAGATYFGPEDGSQDFNAVIEQVQALATEKHDRKTLVIDSFSKLFNKAIADEAERLGDKDAFGASKKPAVAQTRRLINWITRLDMNVILICHEKPLWDNDKQTGVTFDGWDKLEYELHLLLNIVKAGNTRTAIVRKSRLVEFPDADRFLWSYDEFATRYGRDLIEAQGQNIEIATPEQIAELKRLIEVVKLPQATIDKWLTAANAETISELTSHQAAKCIESVRNVVEGKAA
jgi:hypothetical protein